MNERRISRTSAAAVIVLLYILLSACGMRHCLETDSGCEPHDRVEPSFHHFGGPTGDSSAKE